ncbi:hypothetical protein LTS07_005041 [Exophiala sideris]|uniref:Uncharacterized protein n=1 Tax=Exophiala sideris TaxID=1016849 RepID=A0ABR0JE84_9EURO|nr:hypothetical protein LTS07_005041 [Exophiala sideris]KAK5039026.1 hypothetical protein LTR13_004057 [Exophiala sideris]KAK5060911.1 hypothetical protein LTR69_005510 [Exophiala sideris]KAK5183822.1 hypothetical protein LTR44_004104 [Eurotiomycetes sp. CCFEE 6388]
MIIDGSLSYTIEADTSSSNIYDYSVQLAPGCGSTLQSSYSIAAAKVKLEEVVAAIGFLGQLGSAVVALNIAGSISKNLLSTISKVALVDHHFTAAELRSAIAGTQSVILPTGNERVKQMAIQAIIKTMDSVFTLATVAGALSVVSAISMKRERLFVSMAAATQDL